MKNNLFYINIFNINNIIMNNNLFCLYLWVSVMPCVSEIWEKLGLAIVVWFRPEPILDNDQSIPKIVAHIESYQKWHKIKHLAHFYQS